MRGRFWADVFYPGLAEVLENLYPLGARQGQPPNGVLQKWSGRRAVYILPVDIPSGSDTGW